MSIQISNYNFEGPYTDIGPLRNQSGVYVILDCGPRESFVVDVGEAQNVRNRIASHDRKHCWSANCKQTVKVAALYANQAMRMKIEKQIRTQYNPKCGVV